MTLAEALTPLADRPDRAGLVTDFDGTLAPIVDDPARAHPRRDALDALRALADRLALVAVVSGRPLVYLRDQVPLDRVLLVGQYGLERLVDGTAVVDDRAAGYGPALDAAARAAAARWPELRIERKDPAGLAVHWRTRPDAAPPPEALEQLAADHGLWFAPGRLVGELRVPVAVDKGTAVRDLLEGRALQVCAVAGDDRGDLPAFAALTGRAAAGDGFVGVRVAVRSAESPGPLLDDADLVVDGPAGFAAQLAALAAGLTRRA